VSSLAQTGTTCLSPGSTLFLREAGAWQIPRWVALPSSAPTGFRGNDYRVIIWSGMLPARAS
jgi:hypothetical protein